MEKGLPSERTSIVRVNREYGFSDEAISRELKRITGADEWLFVNTLIDEPTEHVDMFMTFVSPTTIVVGQYADHSDPNAALLDKTATRLSRVVVDGTPLQVVRNSNAGTCGGIVSQLHQCGVCQRPAARPVLLRRGESNGSGG